MPTDPLAEIQAIRTAYEALIAKAQTLQNALSAATANNPDSDFVTPDVQAALDSFNAEVQGNLTTIQSTPAALAGGNPLPAGSAAGAPVDTSTTASTDTIP